MKITNEMLEKAKNAKTVEELIALAKENNVEMTGEQAKEYFERMHQSGELDDDELNDVAGGCSNTSDCPFCGSKDTYFTIYHKTCSNCGHVW